MYPVRFSLTKSTFSLIVICIFWYVIIRTDQFYVPEQSLNIHRKFIATSSVRDAAIQLNNIDLVPIEASDGVTKHIVQRGESLSRIATKYGTTTTKIKEINSLSSDRLKVGQELFVTDVPGIIHSVKQDTNFLVFANKYNLNLEDLMTLNYVTQEEATITKGTEVFLPITIEKAYELGIEEKPAPQPQRVIVKNTVPVAKPATPKATVAKAPVAKPVIQPVVQARPTVTAQELASTVAEISPTQAAIQEAQPKEIIEDSGPYAGQVVATRRDNSPIVNNSFYPGYCTYWAARKRPDIFPYISETSQKRTFGGNARQWLSNAQAAGLPTGSTPTPGAIAVFQQWWPGYVSYGHVGIVQKIDRDKRIFLIEDMNNAGKYVVTQRWVDMDDPNISGYIR